MTVRPAKQEDAAALGAMWLEMQAEQSKMDKRYRLSEDAAERWLNDLREWIDAHDVRHVAVAESKGEILGFATSLLTWPPPIYQQQQEVFVEDLFVTPKHRRKGIGSALFNDVIHWARDLSIEQIRLRALSQNLSAIAFWESRGMGTFVTELAGATPFHTTSN